MPLVHALASFLFKILTPYCLKKHVDILRRELSFLLMMYISSIIDRI